MYDYILSSEGGANKQLTLSLKLRKQTEPRNNFGSESSGEENFSNFRTTYTTGGDKVVHQTNTEFEKCTHIKKDSALLRGREIESSKPGSIVHTENESSKFALYSFKSATVTEGRLEYAVIFKNVSNKGVEKC